MSEPIRVLHVDDEPGFIEVTQANLERVSDRLVIEGVEGATDALAYLEDHEIDCIVSDYDMPEMNGIELLTVVRTRYGQIPFILFTGKGGEEVASEAMNHEVTDYIQKRTSTDQFELLVNRIENAVERDRAEVALAENMRQLETLISNLPGIAYRSEPEPPWRMHIIRGDCESITGYPAESLIDGEIFWGEDVIHPEDRAHVRETVNAGLVEDGSFEIRYRIVTALGETKWVWESGQAVETADGPTLEGFINDVTGFHHHREKLRILFEDAADAIVEVTFVDATSIIQQVNPAFEDIFGVEAASVVRTPINDVIVPEGFVEQAADIDQRVMDGEIVEEALQRMTVDGPRWFLLRTVPFTIGTEKRAFATYVDITQQKSREEAIEALHEATRTMIEIPDTDSIVEVTVNAAADVLGLEHTAVYRYDGDFDALIPAATSTSLAEQESKLPWFDVDDTAIWTAFLGGHPVILDDATDELDAFIVGEDTVQSGIVVPIDTWGSLLCASAQPAGFDPADLRLAGLLAASTASALASANRENQLTKLHRAAMQVGATDEIEEVYQQLINTAEEILEFDFAVADAVQNGYLVTMATSSAIDETDFFTRTPIDAKDNIAAAVFRQGEPTLTPDLRELDVTPADPDFLSALTVPIGSHGVFQAAAKRQDAFDEIDLEFAELLVSHVNEALVRLDHNRELESRTRQLDRQNERLEQFASLVSHDLRNPLNVIAGRVELAKEDPEGGHLEAVGHAVNRMEAIIDNTLTLAREGQAVGETEPIDLSKIGKGCWARVDTGDASLEVVDELTFFGDPDRIEHIFENLFRNAIEHGGEGVMIRVGRLESDGFYIADDGPGIPEEDRAKIFDPGYSTGSEGIGIGLAIVTEVVEAHGWSIEITDSWAGGARFEISGVNVES